MKSAACDLSSVTLVIPARNEESTIADVILAFREVPSIDEIIVVDNCSTDSTAEVARNLGCTVVSCEMLGYGAAIQAGLLVSKNEWVFVCDADISSPNSAWFEMLASGVDGKTGIVKGVWKSAADPMPITNFVVRPALSALYPELNWMQSPISGILLVKRACIDVTELQKDYSFSIDIVIRMHEAGYEVKEVELGKLIHADRGCEHLERIAEQTLRYFFDRQRKQVLVLVAHPDDAEIWCGGTIMSHYFAGDEVSIVVATSDEVRRNEALVLLQTMPKLKYEFLHGNEFHLAQDDSLLEEVSQLISRLRPQIIITHHFSDNHVDHANVCRLVQDSLMKAGSSVFPEKILMCSPYFLMAGNKNAFIPDTYVDISRYATAKYHCIMNHRSQNPEYWIKQAKLMDEINGLKSCVDAAEAFETLNYYRTPKAVRKL